MQLAVFEDKQIFVAVIFAQQPLGRRSPINNPLVNPREQVGFFRVVQVFEQFLIVVNRNDRNDRARLVVVVAQAHIIRTFDEVKHHQRADIVFPRHQAAENMEAVFAHPQLGRVLRPAVNQPSGVEGRRDFIDPHAH